MNLFKAEIKVEDDPYGLIEITDQGVGIYDGVLAGMDTFSGRWQTVCERHGTIISHRTLALARKWAKHPADWCELCR